MPLWGKGKKKAQQPEQEYTPPWGAAPPPGVLLAWLQKKGADPWMPGAVPPGSTIPELELILDKYVLIYGPNKAGLDYAATWLLWQAGWQWQEAESARHQNRLTQALM
ncbi:hypothetical protein KIL84_010365 [Mauremys mutica]|uniref:Uncharacterized protein n=1 Tax=Mauremys mutica TaxID=74926 RepID=A0A9D3XC42_9SAUR|nr:hypothetical protein KIL84_010365 [Mauremys mutica]